MKHVQRWRDRLAIKIGKLSLLQVLLIVLMIVPLGAVAFLLAGFVQYQISWMVPRHVDRELFSYVGLTYDENKLVLVYDQGRSYSFAAARISGGVAKKITEARGDIFESCNRRNYAGRIISCTVEWVSVEQLKPRIMMSAMEAKATSAERQARHLFGEATERGSFCTYFPDIVASGDPNAEETYCVNPATGLIVYQRWET